MKQLTDITLTPKQLQALEELRRKVSAEFEIEAMIYSGQNKGSVCQPVSRSSIELLAVVFLRACFRIHFSFVFVQGKGDEASD